MILSYNGNDVTGGAGADTVALSADYALPPFIPPDTTGFGQFEPTVITDFDPAEDSIVVEDRGVGTADAQAIQINVWPDGEGADVLSGDVVLAQVTGGQTLAAADITVIRLLREAYDEYYNR